jgi:hypothetical protein
VPPLAFPVPLASRLAFPAPCFVNCARLLLCCRRWGARSLQVRIQLRGCRDTTSGRVAYNLQLSIRTCKCLGDFSRVRICRASPSMTRKVRQDGKRTKGLADLGLNLIWLDRTLDLLDQPLQDQARDNYGTESRLSRSQR